MAAEEAEAAEAAEECELITEAEGFKLHLSSENATGYLGVTLNRQSGRYGAQAGSRRRSSFCHLGTYDTVVQAAVAVARHLGEKAEEQMAELVSPASSQKRPPSCRGSREQGFYSRMLQSGGRKKKQEGETGGEEGRALTSPTSPISPISSRKRRVEGLLQVRDRGLFTYISVGEFYI